MTPSPNSQQRMSVAIDEYINNRYNAIPTVAVYPNNYSMDSECKSPNTETSTSKTEINSSSERDNDEINQPQTANNKKQLSPILGMILNKPQAHKINALSANEQQKCYPSFYNVSFTNKSDSTHENKELRHQQYEVEQGSTSKTSDSEGVATGQNFGNVSQLDKQIVFPGGEFQNPKSSLDCVQSVLQYGGQEGEKHKIQQHSFYPWMKSFTGEHFQAAIKKIGYMLLLFYYHQVKLGYFLKW